MSQEYEYEKMNETCINNFTRYEKQWCPPYFDKWRCWAPAPPGTNVSQPCPQLKASFSKNGTAWQTCQENGTWFNKTNYDDCVVEELRNFLKMCININNKCDDIFGVIRIIEIVGLVFSFVTLLISLYIFFQFRVLKNNRTKIHKNLFIATLLHDVFRLIRYIDQQLTLEYGFLDKCPYLNEASIAFLEYSKTAMFMWMFIEGLYLHNMITVTVFQEYSYIKLYFYVGWTVPLILTVIWVQTMIITKSIWNHYYFLSLYWILEGPRTIVIVINLLFLINILRVLIIKLRESRTSELEQLRKAVRATIFLLPLMGITNILFLVDYKDFTAAWHLALLLGPTYFLISFQGFFVSILYCFLNGEVQTALKNRFYLHISLRHHDYAPCRNLTVVSSAPPEEPPTETHLQSKTQEKKLNICDLNGHPDRAITLPALTKLATSSLALTSQQQKEATSSLNGNSDVKFTEYAP